MQFCIYIGQMEFNSVLGNPQHGGNVLVTLSFQEKLSHVLFTLAQTLCVVHRQ